MILPNLPMEARLAGLPTLPSWFPVNTPSVSPPELLGRKLSFSVSTVVPNPGRWRGYPAFWIPCVPDSWLGSLLDSKAEGSVSFSAGEQMLVKPSGWLVFGYHTPCYLPVLPGF